MSRCRIRRRGTRRYRLRDESMLRRASTAGGGGNGARTGRRARATPRTRRACCARTCVIGTTGFRLRDPHPILSYRPQPDVIESY
ncbi:hypothetical protein A8H40_07940 [Burkholderia multivorans]|uniref:Uncharacterized protein n=1 Tax=Burkholderia multivorans TaxID=87883 RepID=A0A8E2S3X6_9BURK|nr:hypothetical protein A8H40_07940 [Burkholderia multivorans]PRD91608.1 hypothetical protein C6P76_01520 [Burkholderia multivorans]PRE32759.1 hypothetical protein C6P79_00905 [Burkholderia multivorans]PRF28488.1 hypothetical protein C6P98_01170 [Burkholderia multivorans]PRF32241.1 hypothetical protein C6Q08_15950 [Burkholderia multivorans]